MPLNLSETEEIEMNVVSQKNIDKIRIVDIYTHPDGGYMKIKFKKGYTENEETVYSNETAELILAGDEYNNFVSDNSTTYSAVKTACYNKIKSIHDYVGTIS